MKFKTDII